MVLDFLYTYPKTEPCNMRHLFKYLFLVLTLTSQGCSTLSQYMSDATTRELSNDSDQISQLFNQGLQYQQLTKRQKQQRCKLLQQQYKTNADWHVAWLLAYSLNDNDNCISQKRTLELLIHIQNAADVNPQVLWLNKNQIQLFNKLHKLQQLQGKVDKFQKKNNKLQNKLNKAETQLQQVISKIQALKTIETNINKKLDDEHSNGH